MADYKLSYPGIPANRGRKEEITHAEYWLLPINERSFYSLIYQVPDPKPKEVDVEDNAYVDEVTLFKN